MFGNDDKQLEIDDVVDEPIPVLRLGLEVSEVME